MLTRRGRLRFTAGLAVALAAVPSPSWAQTTDQDKALALQLFDQGRALLGAGNIDEACRKLEESRRLDPLPGTLLNVAVCHEQQGRSASAFVEFREARALAERDGRADRVALADQHLHALEGKVSSLVIVVPPEADRPDLVVTRDATPVGRVSWGSRIPVDPGEHVIEASAANKKSWKAIAKVAPGGDVQTLTLTPLEDATPAASAAAPAVAPAVPAPPSPPLMAPPAAPPAAEHHGLSARRSWALVSAGVALVGAGVGTYLGLDAISKHGDPLGRCMTIPCPQATQLNSQAGTEADASTVSFAIGLAGLGVAAFLWLGDSGDHAASTGVRVLPMVGRDLAGAQVGGGF
jgi:hypothetical protein